MQFMSWLQRKSFKCSCVLATVFLPLDNLNPVLGRVGRVGSGGSGIWGMEGKLGAAMLLGGCVVCRQRLPGKVNQGALTLRRSTTAVRAPYVTARQPISAEDRECCRFTGARWWTPAGLGGLPASLWSCLKTISDSNDNTFVSYGVFHRNNYKRSAFIFILPVILLLLSNKRISQLGTNKWLSLCVTIFYICVSLIVGEK